MTLWDSTAGLVDFIALASVCGAVLLFGSRYGKALAGLVLAAFFIERFSMSAFFLANYLAPFVLMSIPVFLLRDGMLEAFTGALIGAIAIWAWSKPPLRVGILNTCLGMGLTFVFYEQPFPLVADVLFRGREISPLQNGFLYGGVGYIFIAWLVNTMLAKAGKANDA